MEIRRTGVEMKYLAMGKSIGDERLNLVNLASYTLLAPGAASKKGFQTRRYCFVIRKLWQAAWR